MAEELAKKARSKRRKLLKRRVIKMPEIPEFDDRPEAIALLTAIKARLPELQRRLHS